jgi:transcriptional regulator with XRE-family HTH domain
MSSMKEPAPDLDARIASRVRELRAERALSLDALAARSGVSRSMISVIERGRSSATAVVLEKLAAGLDVPLALLFDSPSASIHPNPVARRAEQIAWRDPASGYLRRNVSPPGTSQPMQLVEIEFPPRARVAFESGARDARVYQQIWVLDGTIDVSVGDMRHRLRTGDCLAMQLGAPTMFHNPSRRTARYAVVTAPEIPARR